MCKFKVSKQNNYSVISNYHLRDKSISLKAKGLLTVLLSLPDDWEYSIEGLSKILKEGRDSIRSTLKELEGSNYLEIERERDTEGKLRGNCYHIYEVPKELYVKRGNISEEPESGKPELENPTLDNPTLEKPELDYPTQINKDSTNNLNNKISINQSIYQSNKDGSMDGHGKDIHSYNSYKELLNTQYDYEFFAFKNQKLEEQLEKGIISLEEYQSESIVYDLALFNKVINYILDVLCKDEPIKIGNEYINREIVKSRLLSCNREDMKKVICELRTNKMIRNPKNYAIAMLYNG